MDAIEQRLTTDVTGAQAVVDLGKIVRNVELDRGRPVSLVRIGMVVDALSRYLVDGGAMLYGVVERALLSESALTSKERMVLGRWADDGLIEVTPAVGDRVVEIADITGLPLIAAQDSSDAPPYQELVGRYGWLVDGTGRVLRLSPRAGAAVLTPMNGQAGDPEAAEPVIGRAKVPEPPVTGQKVPEEKPPEEDETAESETAESEPAEPEPAEPEPETAEPEPEPAEPETAEPEPEPEPEPAEPEPVAETDAAEPAANAESGEDDRQVETEQTVPLPVEVFASRGALPVARTRISWHRYARAEPNGANAALLGRRWRCDEFECPVFGEHRRIGQPVPRLRGGVPTCPRHEQPVVDVGPREPSYPVSIVVDDLPRRRLVVRAGRPLSVGSARVGPPGGLAATDGPDGSDLASVASWLHRAATAWISPVHVRLEAGDDGLVVTDVSDNGTVVWQRKGPDDPGATRPLRGESYLLGEWDSVELYTGVELMRGDRRLAAVLGRDELGSVLLDAPTAAHHQVRAG
jgi:hypothetical protein